MATGTGKLGARLPGGGVSNITPTYAVPSTAGLYEDAGQAAARLAGAAQGAMAARSQRAAARAGRAAAEETAAAVAEGREPAKQGLSAGRRILDVVLTDGAYARAYENAALVGLKNDIDAHDEMLRGRFRYDTEGYKAASAAALSGYIQGAPEELAVDVEAYGDDRFKRGLGSVARAAEERKSAEAAQAIGVRIKTLDDQLLGLASNGLTDSIEFQRADAERALLQVERTQNPAILYSDVARIADDDRLQDALRGSASAHAAVLAYGDAGGGLPGRAAAYRLLETEVLNGEAFKDVSPDRRTAIYRDARRQIEEYSKADLEQRREEEAREREARAERREAAGALRLQIMLGEVSEADIRARDDIDDSQKASLIAGARAQARRDRAEARATAALVKAGQAASYREFSDDAAAGTLSEAEIADGVQSGTITRGQAQTLRAKRDRALSPVIDDVMAPVKDAGNRPGRRSSAEKLATAEEQATAWAQRNPEAPLEDRLKAGRAIAERVYGGPKPSAAQPAAQRQGQVNALKQQFAAGKIDRATYNARLKELLNGR